MAAGDIWSSTPLHVLHSSVATTGCVWLPAMSCSCVIFKGLLCDCHLWVGVCYGTGWHGLTFSYFYSVWSQEPPEGSQMFPNMGNLIREGCTHTDICTHTGKHTYLKHAVQMHICTCATCGEGTDVRICMFVHSSLLGMHTYTGYTHIHAGNIRYTHFCLKMHKYTHLDFPCGPL